jgi:hypothetical protein
MANELCRTLGDALAATTPPFVETRVFGRPPTRYPTGVEVLYSFNPKNPCWDFSMYRTGDRVVKRFEKDGSDPWRFGKVTVCEYFSSGNPLIDLRADWDDGSSEWLYPHQMIRVKEISKNA